MAKRKRPDRGTTRASTGTATRRRTRARKAASPLPSTPPPDELTRPQAEARQEAIVEQEVERREEERQRQDDLRFNMLRSIITEPLLTKIHESVRTGTNESFDVIISLNEFYKGGIDEASAMVNARSAEWRVRFTRVSNNVFASLTAAQLLQLAREMREMVDAANATGANPRNAPVIYRIWEDNDVFVSLTRSVATVKADAAQRAFQARGDGIVWAVLDSGVLGTHKHFAGEHSDFGRIDTLGIPAPLRHQDFTPDGRDLPPAECEEKARLDRLGHGTHVAGIIAGYWKAANPQGEPVVGAEVRDEQHAPDEPADEQTIRHREVLREISGVAPACKIVSLKVIADETVASDTVRQTAGKGKVSWLLAAIEQIQEWNQQGKRLLVHGVNMSVGYDFDPRWFACGESPLCIEVNRLVKSGVVVVVSAGNAGYTTVLTRNARPIRQYTDMTIMDPGNAELAITVGSTHKEMPHRYGVSYFSSRGPTGDGRLKPDLLAPGERIISCAAGQERDKYRVSDAEDVLYCEQSGTSMAAPHVSGVVAAFLSVRREFIGQPERVKDLFMQTAIDLRRERKFQGAGLIDLMKALQAV